MPRRAKKLRLRSGLEEKVIEELQREKVKFTYESLKIKYQRKPSTYTPDIVLENGIVVEIKGLFDVEDRSKHLLVKDQHPHLDIRFVFQDSKKKLRKGSSTTYGDWCTKHGFRYADKKIPKEWILEPGQPDNLELHRDRASRQRRPIEGHSA